MLDLKARHEAARLLNGGIGNLLRRVISSVANDVSQRRRLNTMARPDDIFLACLGGNKIRSLLRSTKNNRGMARFARAAREGENKIRILFENHFHETVVARGSTELQTCRRACSAGPTCEAVPICEAVAVC